MSLIFAIFQATAEFGALDLSFLAAPPYRAENKRVLVVNDNPKKADDNSNHKLGCHDDNSTFLCPRVLF